MLLLSSEYIHLHVEYITPQSRIRRLTAVVDEKSQISSLAFFRSVEVGIKS